MFPKNLQPEAFTVVPFSVQNSYVLVNMPGGPDGHPLARLECSLRVVADQIIEFVR